MKMVSFLSVVVIFLVALAVPLKGQDSIEDYLSAHNEARAAVGVGPMEWDDTVAAYAQSYANERAGDCALEHSVDGPYGENLAKSTGDLSGVEAVKLWVDEQIDYDYSSNTCNPGKDCLHYTQIVWRDSVRLGCAKVTCNDGGTFIICSYDPPGNYVGQWPY